MLYIYFRGPAPQKRMEISFGIQEIHKHEHKIEYQPLFFNTEITSVYVFYCLKSYIKYMNFIGILLNDFEVNVR